MDIINFFEIFLEIYNAGAAFILIFLIGQILIMMHKADKDMLKAKLFLNDVIIQQTWLYISIAGAAFSLNAGIKFIIRFTSSGELFKTYYLYEVTQLIFLIAFICAVHSWYTFIGSFVNRK